MTSSLLPLYQLRNVNHTHVQKFRMSSNADRGQKIVENILKSPGNNNCVDCGALGKFKLNTLAALPFTLPFNLLLRYSFYLSSDFTFTRYTYCTIF